MEYRVKVLSEGLACGSTFNTSSNYLIKDGLCSNSSLEIKIFNKAINDVIKDLECLTCANLKKDEDFVNVHILILRDPQLSKEVCELIENKRFYAPKAFDTVVQRYIEKFDNATSAYIKERALDLKDIRNRVLKKLDNLVFKKLENEQIILMCDELYPSMLMEFKDNICGVIARKGGTTSHSAILTKAREIPYVILDNIEIKDNTNVIIDTRKQTIYLEPTLEEINHYKRLKGETSNNKPIYNFTKHKIGIYSNVSSSTDIDKTIKYNLCGVGLFRTEFIFMNQTRPMSLEEQYQVYNEAVLNLFGKPICFRTFDIGDDKKVSYINTNRKGIHNYKENKDLFEDQIKAILRTNKLSNVSVMFPMIRTYEEFKYLKDWVYKIKRKENNNSYIKVGMMIETKEALNSLSDFKDIDFMSIGTNDLTCELYGIKRDEVLNHNDFIDDLMIQIKKISDHCKLYNIGLSICGELASCGDVLEKLYNANIRKFSVSPSNSKVVELALKKCLKIER